MNMLEERLEFLEYLFEHYSLVVLMELLLTSHLDIEYVLFSLLIEDALHLDLLQHLVIFLLILDHQIMLVLLEIFLI